MNLRRNFWRYHEDALEVFTQLGMVSKNIDWNKLHKVLTHDVRQHKPIAVFESASEFQFYSFASDHAKRIFFSMDIRDMGVELMLHYEHSNREVGYHKYSDTDLMDETFRASDAIDERRRFTYDRVVEIFKKYYDRIPKAPLPAMQAAKLAFGEVPEEPLGSFAESVQIMLGGDEVYAAAHPLYCQYIPDIVSDLDKTQYRQDRTINMRVSVAFSTGASKDRIDIQKAHQEGMKLADEAPGTLKKLERTQRRIERLIDMLEANPKKKARGPGYRKELEKLPLTKLFARSKHKNPHRLSFEAFTRLIDALKNEDIKAAQNEGFELVDFNGNAVNGEKLEKDAQALEDKVRRDVGPDNMRGHPPPVTKMPGWVDHLLDCWEGKKYPCF